MSDTLSAARSDATATMLTPNRPPAASGDSGSSLNEPEIVVPPSLGGQERGVGAEPLARIEDKTSRIEEKLARSEAAMQRVVDRFELASSRMNEVATQSELAAVRGEVSFIAGRVRRVPGWTALVGSSLVTAVLTAVAVVLVLRYFPGAPLR